MKVKDTLIQEDIEHYVLTEEDKILLDKKASVKYNRLVSRSKR